MQVPQYEYQLAGDQLTRDDGTPTVISFAMYPISAQPSLPLKGIRLREIANKKDLRLPGGEDTFKLSQTSAKITYRLLVSLTQRP